MRPLSAQRARAALHNARGGIGGFCDSASGLTNPPNPTPHTPKPHTKKGICLYKHQPAR
jgi:hypothetical protein